MHAAIRSSVLVAATAVIALASGSRGLQAAPQAKTAAAHAEHAVAGEVTKVDHAAKTVAVRTADGAEETVKFSERTAVHGAKDVKHAADAGAKAGLEGGTAVVRYTGEGADRTATRIDHLGKRSLKAAKGTVVKVDRAGESLVVKTAAGTEETFHLTKDAVVDGGKGIADAAGAAGHGLDRGAEVTVHYSEEAGKKLVHLVKHA